MRIRSTFEIQLCHILYAYIYIYIYIYIYACTNLIMLVLELVTLYKTCCNADSVNGGLNPFGLAPPL